ncbi:hypothetical protein BJL96_28920 [Burkholderia cenocepacia]|nr:hypothetical protein [Burkholderia cenocepacia]
MIPTDSHIPELNIISLFHFPDGLCYIFENIGRTISTLTPIILLYVYVIVWTPVFLLSSQLNTFDNIVNFPELLFFEIDEPVFMTNA